MVTVEEQSQGAVTQVASVGNRKLWLILLHTLSTCVRWPGEGLAIP